MFFVGVGIGCRIDRRYRRGAGRRNARWPCFVGLILTSRTKRIARSSDRMGGSFEARLRGRRASLSGLWRTDATDRRHH
jgi:hypothetical protein